MVLCILCRERGEQSFEVGNDFLASGQKFSISIDERSFFGKEIMKFVPTALAQRSNKMSVGLYLPIGGNYGCQDGGSRVRPRKFGNLLPDSVQVGLIFAQNFR